MIYLDYNSTTPTDKRVIDTMIPTFGENFGNPSSTYDKGIDAADLIDDARKSIASLISANSNDIVFTSGATEANNMIISNFTINPDHDCRLLYGATEHKSVIEPCKALSENRVNIIPISVNIDGTINLDSLKKYLETPTDMVSIMMANSETGGIKRSKTK